MRWDCSRDEETEREAGKEEICVDQVSVTWRREVLESILTCHGRKRQRRTK